MLFKCYVEIKLPLFKMTTFSGIENSVPYFIEFLGESFVKKNNIHQIKQLQFWIISRITIFQQLIYLPQNNIPVKYLRKYPAWLAQVHFNGNHLDFLVI